MNRQIIQQEKPAQELNQRKHVDPRLFQHASESATSAASERRQRRTTRGWRRRRWSRRFRRSGWRALQNVGSHAIGQRRNNGA